MRYQECKQLAQFVDLNVLMQTALCTECLTNKNAIEIEIEIFVCISIVRFGHHNTIEINYDHFFVIIFFGAFNLNICN